MTAAMAPSASELRPRASRHNERYCSIDFRSVAMTSDGSPLSTASASSYRADAYRSRAAVNGFSRPSRNCACAGAASATIIDVVTRNRAFMTHLALDEVVGSRRLLHINAEAHGRAERHRDRLTLLTQLRMPEHDFMGPDRNAQVSDGRLTHAAAVDPDLRPGCSIQIDDAHRQLERNRRDLPGRDHDHP